MRIPRTRFCRAPSLITICEAIPPPGISKVDVTAKIERPFILIIDQAKLMGNSVATAT